MKNNYRSLNVFVSHSFDPNPDYFSKEEFRENINSMVKEAENLVRIKYADFKLNPIFELSDINENLSVQIQKSIKQSHFAIVDMSEYKPNIFFEYGLMKGLDIHTLLIEIKKSQKDKAKKKGVPTDIVDEYKLPYETFNTLKEKGSKKIANFFLNEFLESKSFYNVYLNEIWFPHQLRDQDIQVIVSSRTKKRDSASPDSDNYEFLENLGDKDALLEVMKFLYRNYQNANILFDAADKFREKKDFETKNIVIIGGPGKNKDDSVNNTFLGRWLEKLTKGLIRSNENEDEYSNSVCQEMQKYMDFKIKYSDDCEEMLVDGKSYKAKRKDGKIIEDYGYFARFPNPLDPNFSVIMIHGIHTFGVLGAAKAFSNNSGARDNIKKVLEKLKVDNIEQASFECFFPVKVRFAGVKCPSINMDDIYYLVEK